jgi:hypothetical protein
MASKLNMMTFLQQVQSLAAVAERCPQPRRPARLMLRALSSAAVRRRRLMISIVVQNPQANPSPVSITLLKAAIPPPAVPS